MKLSISNIGWTAQNDNVMYEVLSQKGFDSLEIAPTRIFTENPYQHCTQATEFAKTLEKNYKLKISSMQSIWYGKAERIAHSKQDAEALLAYTKEAILFADAVGCKNLVFGCPKNRTIDQPEDEQKILDFLICIANEAEKYGVVIALEANPKIYNTNFINTTKQALDILEKINHPALKLNLDTGTMIHNQESVSILQGKIDYIHHVHISEPYLKPIQQRELHREIYAFLREEKYCRYISIEMGIPEKHKDILNAMDYMLSIFKDSDYPTNNILGEG